MKSLAAYAKQPAFAAAVRAVLDPEHYRVIWQGDTGADPWLRQGNIDACVVDADLTDIEPIRLIEKLRRQDPACPILVYAGLKQWEWEEEDYILGVTQVLTKPIRGRLLNNLLDRLWQPERLADASAAPVTPRAAEVAVSDPPRAPIHTLEVLRDFSRILTHSLCSEALLRQFLLLLREILGVNRAAIFLRAEPSALSPLAWAPEERRLRAACAQGINPGLLDHFELNLGSGIGGYVHRHGRILNRASDEARTDREVQKEFELLGAQVAIPILDPESLIGVAVFDGRVTGGSFTSEELALLFHLLEGLGLAIRNSWLHDQLAGSYRMMTDILDQLEGGCVVVGRDLTILHANHAARACFGAADRGTAGLQFSDLPQQLGSKVFEVLKTGVGLSSFKYQPPHATATVYCVTILPFHRQQVTVPNAALLLVEDFTQHERSHRLEIEAANLRLAKVIAEHLAHEIGNSLVPISTYQQLLAEKYNDPEFRKMMASAMAGGVKRISRLSNQMLFMARDITGHPEVIAVKQLLEEAFGEATTNQPAKDDQLHFETGIQPLELLGDRKGLKHAFAEIMLNALQANPADPQVRVRVQTDADTQGGQWVRVEVQDSGDGFSADASPKAMEPFFTTRNVGLGLGLTVTQRIIENHQGKIEIVRQPGSNHGVVRISLPVPPASN
jgi:nitrogen-specific signal transduction histidine kinase/DNA-binding NarL/FixJ family response regulator